MINSLSYRFTRIQTRTGQKFVFLSVWAVLAFFTNVLFAQNATDSTGVSTEIVDVVKSYTPSIILRPKSKWQLSAAEDVLMPRPEFSYTHDFLNLIPSDLPSLLSATGPGKEKDQEQLPNYVRFYLGTRASAGVEGFVTKSFNKEANLTVALDHQQLNGPIEPVPFSTDWAESGLRTQWRSKLANRTSTLGVSLKRSSVQFYGISDTLTVDSLLSDDFGQVYNRGTLYHRLGSNGGWFSGIDNEFSFFSDRFGVAEWKFSSAPKAELIWDKRIISFSGNLSFLSMKLSLDDTLITAQDYNALNADLGAQTDLDFGDLTVNLGAKVWAHDGGSGNTFRLFPELELSYPILERRLNAHLGFSGQYKQYQASTLTESHAFLAPGLVLKPQIDRQIVRFGISGIVTESWQYNLDVVFRNFEDQAYFVQRPWSGEQGLFAYDNGNSFTIDYHEGTELKYTAKINGRLSDRWDVTLNAALIDNRPANNVAPWNIPEFSFGGSGSYHVNEQILLTGRFVSYGARMDQLTIGDEVNSQSVDGFIDAQLHLHWALTKNFSTSLSGINLFNQNNGLWVNYPVQGLRVNLGLQYNFNAF